MIKILVDSSSDCLLEDINNSEIDMLPMSISIGDDTFIEGENITRKEFFERLTAGCDFPKTSQPSPQAFVDYFEKIKADNDELIYICLSTGLSGTYQSALLAKDMVDYENIYIIDSCTATYAIKIMADYALQLSKENVPAKEIVTRLETLKSKVKILAVLDTLEYLGKGGRLNKGVAAIGDLAGIKPLITVTENGEIGVIGKAMGRNKALHLIMQHLDSYELNADFPVYSIYSMGTENSDRFEARLTAKNITPKTRSQIGPTIGTHIGPGAYGIVFVCK
ncbi:MAG: DegV family protein [Lachnospiraceae bacterium]|nr:DegV family protein [Lachnospiraceae bacterium]